MSESSFIDDEGLEVSSVDSADAEDEYGKEDMVSESAEDEDLAAGDITPNQRYLMIQSLQTFNKHGWKSFLEHSWTRSNFCLQEIRSNWGRESNFDNITSKIYKLLNSLHSPEQRPLQPMERAQAKRCCLCGIRHGKCTIYIQALHKGYTGSYCAQLAQALVQFGQLVLEYASQVEELSWHPFWCQQVHEAMYEVALEIRKMDEAKGGKLK